LSPSFSLAGKKCLILGLANEHSNRAEVVVSYLNEQAVRFVAPLT
jgi:hypothetical protein